jgi:hypothetical protein
MDKTKKKRKDGRVMFTAWVRPEIKEALDKKAESQNRSRNNMVEVLLEEVLKEYLPTKE